MKKRILVTAPISDALVEKIAATDPDLVVTRETLPEGGFPENRTVEADILYTTNRVPRLEKAPNLAWVNSHWAGVDSFVDTQLWESDVILTSSSGIHAPNMGQFALAMMLAWAQRVPTWLNVQRGGRWPNRRWEKYLPDELAGKTLGILGYGSIGREVARLARAFGMTILVTKRDARHVEDTGYTIPGFGDPAGEIPARIYPSEATRSMVALCDYVVVTLPLTPKTRHLIDETVLREMKSTAFIVNIGRGEVIHEKDLVKALQRGWIAGAGLDVFEVEPLPESSELWQMENVILTPHVSGFTAEYDERAVDLFVLNLRRFLAGEPLLNQVSREQGY